MERYDTNLFNHCIKKVNDKSKEDRIAEGEEILRGVFERELELEVA